MPGIPGAILRGPEGLPRGPAARRAARLRATLGELVPGRHREPRGPRARSLEAGELDGPNMVRRTFLDLLCFNFVYRFLGFKRLKSGKSPHHSD